MGITQKTTRLNQLSTCPHISLSNTGKAANKRHQQEEPIDDALTSFITAFATRKRRDDDEMERCRRKKSSSL